MTDTWKSIFTGTIENRPVKIESYDEGGYRIHTTQGADYPGLIKTANSSTLIIPPAEKGSVIVIEAESVEELHQELLAEGFSESSANEIINKLLA